VISNHVALLAQSSGASAARSDRAEDAQRDTKLVVARFVDDRRAASVAKPPVKVGRRLVEAHELLALQPFEVLDADAGAAAKCAAVLLSAFRAAAIQHPHQWPDNLELDAAAQQLPRTFAIVAPLFSDPPQLEL
jgi:hypothetical protein